MKEPLDIRFLPGPTGAEVVGATLEAAISHDGARAWHAALDRRQLVVFRGLELDADEQVALLETLGPALIENDRGRPYQYVSNAHEEGILGDERFAFHSDHAFMDEPIDVISLQPIELPPGGSETRFTNAIRAGRELPESLRIEVEGRQARHVIDPGAESERVAISGPALGDDLPHAWHPVLWTHPRTGEPILYVSEQQTDRIEGLDGREGRLVIEKLFAHLYVPRFSYTHAWREHDLVVWDNRSLQHARDAVPRGTRRTLRRVSIGGTPVHEYFRNDPKWGLAPAEPS